MIDVLTGLSILRGVPGHVRSDNCPEVVVVRAVRDRIDAVGAKTTFNEPRSAWENGCRENFDLKVRDELLNGERSSSLAEARVIIAAWRVYCQTAGPTLRRAIDRQFRRPFAGRPAMADHPRPNLYIGAEARHELRPKTDNPIGAGHVRGRLGGGGPAPGRT